MRDYPQAWMKLGIVLPMAYPEIAGGDGPILDALTRVIEDDYFSAVEITRVNETGLRQQIARMLKASGLDVCYGAHPIILGERLDLNDGDALQRQMAIDRMKTCLDEAGELGAGSFMLLSGRHPGSHGAKEAALDRLVDSLVQICSHAHSVGEIKVILETFDYNVDKCALLGLSSDAAAVAAKVRMSYPGFGLAVDLSHIPLIGESDSETLTNVRDYLVHVHIGNCMLRDKSHPVYGDNHPRFGLPGSEVDAVRLAAFLSALAAVGYIGKNALPKVAFEIKPQPGESPELIIANAKRTLSTAWSMVPETAIG